MRKTVLVLTIGAAGLLAAGLVVFLQAGPDAEQPAAASVVATGGSAGPAGGGNSVVSPQGQQQDNTFVVDSLTQEEIARAQSMVANDPRVVEHTKGLRYAVLLVDRHNEEKDNLQARRAEVFIHVYSSSRTLYGLANLRTNTVDQVEVRPGAQVSFTPTEAAWALDIALADPEAGALIREQYQQMTGSPLLRPDQLQVSMAGAFNYTYTHISIPTASACGVRRCVRLVILGINAMPIVDLSSERVVYPGQ